MSNSIKKLSLLKFLELNKDLPVQGSIEWLKSRSETIGGSEISTILNINKYQNVKQLIEQKVGISSFKKAPPLWFGNLFEYILQQYTEILFNTTIYETGSIPYNKSNLIKYSPDGLAIINKNKLNKFFTDEQFEEIFNNSLFENNIINNKELLILFEFKNPYMRVIKPNEIPEYYINQPKLGMEVIDICEVSIFIESIFRFCSYNDIIKNNNFYNRFYHFDRNKYINDPLAYGAFTLYYEKNNHSQHLLNLLNNIGDYMHNNNIHKYDISNIKDKNIINSIMENIIDYKDLKIIYHNICINQNKISTDKFSIYDDESFYFHKYNNINKYKNEIINNKLKIRNDNKLEYLGIMSYKMFNININPIFKQNPLNNDVLCKIQKIINLIQDCNKYSSDDDGIKLKKQLINCFKY